MKEIELFYLTHCPYCIKARKAVEELTEEEYKKELHELQGRLNIRWIEESREPALAGSRDYYYVPSLFCEGKKLYEASPAEGFTEIKENIRAACTAVLNE